MHYNTRRLEALSDFNLGRDHIRRGDEFFATHVDASHLVSIGQAREIEEIVLKPSAKLNELRAPEAERQVPAESDNPSAAAEEMPVKHADVHESPSAADAEPRPVEAHTPAAAPSSRRRSTRQPTPADGDAQESADGTAA